MKAEWQTTRRHVTEVLAKRRQIVCSLVLQPSLLHVLSFLLSLLRFIAVRLLLCLPYLHASQVRDVPINPFVFVFLWNRAAQVLMPLGFARRSKTRLVASEFANQIEYGPTSHIELHVTPTPHNRNPYKLWLQHSPPATPWIALSTCSLHLILYQFEEPKQLKLLSGLLTWVYRNIEA